MRPRPDIVLWNGYEPGVKEDWKRNEQYETQSYEHHVNYLTSNLLTQLVSLKTLHLKCNKHAFTCTFYDATVLLVVTELIASSPEGEFLNGKNIILGSLRITSSLWLLLYPKKIHDVFRILEGWNLDMKPSSIMILLGITEELDNLGTELFL